MRDVSRWLALRGPAVPALVAPAVMARTLGGFYVFGGVIAGFMALLMPADTSGNRGAVLAFTLVGVVVGVALLALGERVNAVTHSWLIAFGTALITFAIMLSTSDVTALALAAFYALLVCDAAFFLSWRLATLHTVLVVVCAMLVLWARPGMPWWSGLVTAGVAVAVLFMVGGLARLAADADLDSLTGLSNRRGFDRSLDLEISRASRTGVAPAVILFDLDGFKAVNDEYGHTAGDAALQDVARRWRDMVGDRRILARYGGDEFALLLPGMSEQGAVLLADRMRDAVRLDVSAGVTTWQPGESASFMVSRADVGLYRAKGSGRNRTVLESAHQPPLAAELEAAIRHEAVRVHYQPIVSLPEGTLLGFEALLRWRSEVQQGITPAEVIRIAEAHGLIPRLGQFVLRHACIDAHTLQRRYPDRRLLLSVNVSGLELVDPAYVDAVDRILLDTAWPAAQLILEVTETALDVETPVTVANLTELRTRGIRIAIDDFGTGYSSLHRITTLPTDLLKLDRSFVAPAGESTPPLLAVIARLSVRLDLPVIVEGVEDGYQAELLATMGYTLAQGFYFGRPEPLLTYTQTSAAAASSARGASTP